MIEAVNPIIGGNFADPSVIREGEEYYMVHGGAGYRSLLLWHSRDLVHWQALYPLLTEYSEPVWAPELVKVKDRYYLYCFGNNVWMMQTSDIRNGPWTAPEVIEGVEGIDPGHFEDHLENRWLFVENNRVYPLNSEGNKITGGPVQVCPPWPVPDSWDIEGECCEAPKLLKKNGYIYLTAAQGGTQGPPTSHAVISFRARDLAGPWECSPYNPISHCSSREETWWSRGHGTLIDTVRGEWFIMYHAIRKDHRHLGRMTLMEPVEWTEDDWFRIPDSSAPDKPFVVNLTEAAVPMYYNEENCERQPDLRWNFLSSADRDRVEADHESIKIMSRGTSLHDSGPMLMNNHFLKQDFTARVTVAEGAAGGICFYYSAKLSFGIALDNGFIRIYDQDKPWLDDIENQRPWPGNTIWFRLSDNHGVISPWYSSDGESWIKFNRCGEVSSWNSNSAEAGGFYGALRPGLFSCKLSYSEFSQCNSKQK